jgi:hypothetical protein
MSSMQTIQSKPNSKNRDDIKVIITATSLTLTLAFWNLFSNGAQKPIQTVNVVPTSVPPQMQQVKLLLGGPPPKTTVFISQSGSPQNKVQRHSQQSAPQPVAKTGSSK